MKGATVSHYHILDRIGAGGMGVVYRAEDTRLGRQVAIKFLSEEILARPASLERFMREARTVSALSHPGICTLHDIGEHEGRPFLVMELLEGETLAERLGAAGALPLQHTIEIAIQVCDALDVAHSRGIVHRDVKPANAFLTRSGTVKLLDFGIATVMGSEAATATIGHPPPGAPLTLDGAVIGTLAYLAPEQARGEAVDGRSDIFSLGAVIFEMVTGRRAFPGAPSIAVQAVLDSDPLAQAHLPPAITAVLTKALQKQPQRRYQRVADLRDDLRSLSALDTPRRATTTTTTETPHIGITEARDVHSSGPRREPARRWWLLLAGLVAALAIIAVMVTLRRWAGARGIDSLAVLPFENATGDPQMEYLSDGLTVSLINRLAELPGLRVRSRSSAFSFKGKAFDPEKVGKDLEVAGVLNGSVGRQGERLLVSVELVDAVSGSQVWGTRFTRPGADLLALEDELARSIAAELQPRLSAEDERLLARRETNDREAYDLYLRGDFEAAKFTEPALYAAIDYYKRALAIDPAYSLAHTGMAHAYFWLTDWYAPPRDVSIPSLEASSEALRINERNAPAHGLVGLVQFIYSWDWPIAEREFKRALELDPAEGRSRAYYAWFLAAQGRGDEAAREAARAEQVEPLSSEIVTVSGLALYVARRYDEAAAAERRVIGFDPAFVWSHIILGRALLAQGHANEALESLERAYTMEPTLPEAVAGRAQGQAAVGRETDARATFVELSNLGSRRHVSPFDVATIHAALGEEEEALRQLDAAYEQRAYLLASIGGLAFFDGLRDRAAFLELLSKLELPELVAGRAPSGS